MDPLKEFMRKDIVVYTSDGVSYNGMLVEANENFLEMMGETGWISVPMEKITSVQGKDAAQPTVNNNSTNVTKDFYFDPRFDPLDKK